MILNFRDGTFVVFLFYVELSRLIIRDDFFYINNITASVDIINDVPLRVFVAAILVDLFAKAFMGVIASIGMATYFI